LQALIAEYPDINFAAGNVLLSNRVRLRLAMDELDPLGQLLVVVHDGRARDTD
jgi:hypothetical protein